MLLIEAQWFKDKIANMESKDIFPMLNIGSSTKHFRKVDQPWIDEYLFKPLGKEKVFHVDLKQDDGVDFVGDISDVSFQKNLLREKPKSIICLNLLKHVINRQEICHAMISMIPIGGYIFVSCPYKFPYHADPIDTLFRPNITELLHYFPGMNLIIGEVVIGENYFTVLVKNKLRARKTLIRLLFPFFKPNNWYRQAVYFPWLFRNYEATCMVLQKYE